MLWSQIVVQKAGMDICLLCLCAVKNFNGLTKGIMYFYLKRSWRRIWKP